MIIDGGKHEVSGFGVPGFDDPSKWAFTFFRVGEITVVDKGGEPVRYITADTKAGVYRRYRRENGRLVTCGRDGEGKFILDEETVQGPLRLKFKHPVQFGFFR